MQRKVILASTSPRRIELLKQTNLSFEIVPSDYEEDMTLKLSPEKLAETLAYGKANVVAEKFPDAIVIGGDTLVSFENEVLGKPHTPERAIAMLKKLSGKTHFVITGLAIISKDLNNEFKGYHSAKVKFRDIAEKEIEEYVATGEPLDKAGAYAIFEGGGKFVESVLGDKNSVSGLPLDLLIEVLNKDFNLSVSKTT